jgi:hypothetical protein
MATRAAPSLWQPALISVVGFIADFQSHGGTSITRQLTATGSCQAGKGEELKVHRGEERDSGSEPLEWLTGRAVAVAGFRSWRKTALS